MDIFYCYRFFVKEKFENFLVVFLNRRWVLILKKKYVCIVFCWVDFVFFVFFFYNSLIFLVCGYSIELLLDI